MTTAEEQQAVFDAAARLGPMEVLGMQISVVVSMLRAMYTTHPHPAKVRYNFDQLIGQLLASPYVGRDPDHALILRDVAANLVRPPQDINPIR
ncbi:hypothetical protein J2W35_005402 [Variovorax boronicumulans]|uniref:hypothetical protein n=1 Tax=Variovorax boronicumulans TaxID=436515 RepID=UPI00278A908D|nr:hypothetical protein [Variovorax boronicumulans]MDQ0085028.1 hypothetical protein [Variovorax boronicumulans]